jgi:membrane protein
MKTKVVPLFQQTFQGWNSDQCPAMGASLAYYLLFSLFPLLLVVLSIIGFVYSSVGTEVSQMLGGVTDDTVELETDAESASSQIFTMLRTSVSEQAANQIEKTLAKLEESRRGAGIIGFAMLLVTASGVFGQLDRTFNVIWKVDPQQQGRQGMVGTALKLVQKKLFAFALVLGSALLLFISMSSGVVIRILSGYTTILPGNDMLWGYVHALVAFLILAFTLMLLFKYLPDLPITWGDVWMGGFLTAVLFTILTQISSFVIAQSDFESYGVVGGIMALLLWIFLSSQVLFFGAEFTHSYAHLFGSYASGEQETPRDAEAVAATTTAQAAVSPSPAEPAAAAAGATAAQQATPAGQPAAHRAASGGATTAGLSFAAGMLTMLVLGVVGVLNSGVQMVRMVRQRAGQRSKTG